MAPLRNTLTWRVDSLITMAMALVLAVMPAAAS